MIHSLSIDYSKETNSAFRRIVCGERSSDNRKLLPEKMEFTKGLNIIIGANGSGKSTLINMINSLSLFEGYSGNHYDRLDILRNLNLEEHLTFDTVPFDNNVDIRMDFSLPTYLLKEIKEQHGDEQMKDFESFGRLYVSKNSSRGECLINELSCFVERTQKQWKDDKSHYSIDALCSKIGQGKYDEQIRDYVNRHQQHTDDEQITILLDEPDSGLDIFNLKEVKNMLVWMSQSAQVIVALHNPLLIKSLQDKANIIELTPDYQKAINDFS